MLFHIQNENQIFVQQSSRFPKLGPSQLFFPQTRSPRQSESALQSPSPSPQGDSSVQQSFIPPSHTSVQQSWFSSKKPPLQLFFPHLRPLSQNSSPLQLPSLRPHGSKGSQLHFPRHSVGSSVNSGQKAGPVMNVFGSWSPTYSAPLP